MKALLPIGSIIRLKDGVKRLMIYGIYQSEEDSDIEYDYIGVIYPEGNIGDDFHFLFQHEDIEEVYFRGYEDEEREDFLKRLEEVREELSSEE